MRHGVDKIQRVDVDVLAGSGVKTLPPKTTTATSAFSAAATASLKPDWSLDRRSHPFAQGNLSFVCGLYAFKWSYTSPLAFVNDRIVKVPVTVTLGMPELVQVAIEHRYKVRAIVYKLAIQVIDSSRTQRPLTRNVTPRTISRQWAINWHEGSLEGCEWKIKKLILQDWTEYWRDGHQYFHSSRGPGVQNTVMQYRRPAAKVFSYNRHFRKQKVRYLFKFGLAVLALRNS